MLGCVLAGSQGQSRHATAAALPGAHKPAGPRTGVKQTFGHSLTAVWSCFEAAHATFSQDTRCIPCSMKRLLAMSHVQLVSRQCGLQFCTDAIALRQHPQVCAACD